MFLCLAWATAARASAPDATSHTLQVHGQTRSYQLYVPPDVAGRVPLVIVLHGFGGDGAAMLEQGHWTAKAQAEGFMVVAPDGLPKHPGRRPSFFFNPRSWNAGAATGSPAQAAGVDDVAFIAALLDSLEAVYPVDSQRVYVTGFSNGAGMVWRVAAELSDRIAAAAPVSNALLEPVETLQAPVSLLLIWGKDDPLNPIAGGEVKRGDRVVTRPSAAESLTRWRQLLHCPAATQTDSLATGVTRQRSGPCDAGTVVEFITLDGMGHQWPGGKIYFRLIAGSGSNAIDATDVIWQFFTAHPAKER